MGCSVGGRQAVTGVHALPQVPGRFVAPIARATPQLSQGSSEVPAALAQPSSVLGAGRRTKPTRKAKWRSLRACRLERCRYQDWPVVPAPAPIGRAGRASASRTRWSSSSTAFPRRKCVAPSNLLDVLRGKHALESIGRCGVCRCERRTASRARARRPNDFEAERRRETRARSRRRAPKNAW